MLSKLFRRFNYLKFQRSFSSYIKDFTNILGENNIQTNDLDSFNTDWLGSHHGKV